MYIYIYIYTYIYIYCRVNLITSINIVYFIIYIIHKALYIYNTYHGELATKGQKEVLQEVIVVIMNFSQRIT